MGVRVINGDNDMAVLYSSTTDWAFGPVFYAEKDHDAVERAESFLRWLQVNGKVGPLYYSDPREFTDSELERKYTEWKGQEEDQWKKEAEEEASRWRDI